MCMTNGAWDGQNVIGGLIGGKLGDKLQQTSVSNVMAGTSSKEAWAKKKADAKALNTPVTAQPQVQEVSAQQRRNSLLYK